MTRANSIRTLSLAALITLVACTGTISRGQVQEQFHQSVPVSGVPTVHVDNVAGNVRIRAWNKPTVDVEATKNASETSELRGITISIHSVGTNIFVATKYSSSTHSGGVTYSISVPSNASLEIKNVAGTVDIVGVHGSVGVKTQAGTIAADLGRVDGNRLIDLSATTGTVRLSIARNSSASVNATSTVGGFSSDFPSVAKSTQNIVGASATGTIGAGSAKIHISTTTGTIALKASP